MKKANDYFEMMDRLASYSADAAEMLENILKNFNPEQIDQNRQDIHAIEHAADGARHEILTKLSREFITPLERDDILQLVQIIDDVTDALDEVVINLYMFNIRTLSADTLKLSALVLRCVHALEAAVAQLRHFKKTEPLAELLIEVNTIESEADTVYTEAMRSLFTSGADPLHILGQREVYECLESCCDLCEHAADVIENIVMKNT
ncbi:MAG: DUF47 family protein [Clostridia bacterium]